MELLYKLAKEVVQVAYENGALYVNTDMIRKYSPVNPSLGYAILTGDWTLLENVQAAIYPEVVLPKEAPKVWTDMPVRGVEMYAVNSSNVKSVGYDQQLHLLYVEYQSGDIYEYQNVPEEYWDALCKADSKGSWIHWFIKINAGDYPYKKVPGANLVPSTKPIDNTGSPHENGYMTGFKETEKE